VTTILGHVNRYIARCDAATSHVSLRASRSVTRALLMEAGHAQVKELEHALARAQSAGQELDAAAAPALEQLRQAQLQLQSQTAIFDQLCSRREKLKQKNIRLKSDLAAAASERSALAHELDAAIRARAAAEEAAADARAAADAARREKCDADGAVSSAAAKSAASAAEVKSLRLELEQAVEARESAQGMLSAINDRCFELMQQCRHLTQAQRDAEARAEAAQSQLLEATRDFDSRFEATVLDLQQEETRACEEEAARCKLDLRAHDLEQRLRASDAAAHVAQQRLAQQLKQQLDVEKQQSKMVKQAAELRLARDEVRASCFELTVM
jgi:hypothetical protein